MNKASVNTPTVFLCKHKFSFFWPKCPRVKLLGMVTAGLLLREIPCLLAIKEKEKALLKYNQRTISCMY